MDCPAVYVPPLTGFVTYIVACTPRNVVKSTLNAKIRENMMNS